jgi:hypothetical protein
VAVRAKADSSGALRNHKQKNNGNGKGKNSRRSFDSLRSLKMTISIWFYQVLFGLIVVSKK